MHIQVSSAQSLTRVCIPHKNIRRLVLPKRPDPDKAGGRKSDLDRTAMCHRLEIIFFYLADFNGLSKIME